MKNILFIVLFLPASFFAQTAETYYKRGIDKFEKQDYRGAIADYTKRIELNSDYAEAYFNRGITKLILGQKDSECLDFSKAGELGYSKAYNLIRKYCN